MREQARRDFPTNLGIRYLEARVAQKRGDLAGAEKTLDEVLEVQPGYADASLLKADIQADQQRFDEAAKTLKAAQEHSSDERLQLMLDDLAKRRSQNQ